MRIALFHDFLVRMGGAEHVFFTLANMFPEADLYTLFVDKEALARGYPEHREVRVHPGAQKRFDRIRQLPKIGKQVTKLLLPWYARWVEEMDFSAYDLVIVNSTAWALGIVTPVDTPVVCYVHSPARFLWDYYPEYKRELGATNTTGWKNMFLTRSLSRLRLWNSMAGQRPEFMVCNSHTVAERINKFYRREDVTVLYPPVDVSGFQCTGPNPSGDAVLLTTLSPYKNVDALLAWWKNQPGVLHIAGDGPDRERLEKLAPPNVRFHGFVSSAKRNQLLQNARCVFYPSKEDFGIGPIEAMACGKLTLALGQGGALETIHDGMTGIFYPDLSAESLDVAWGRFEALESTYNPQRLRAAAEKYSSERFQRALLDYLRDHKLLKS